jgi:predicted DsbA family dithiol-disulfide isomerase
MQKLVFPVLLAIAVVALAGASCNDKSETTPVEAKEMVQALDTAQKKSEPVNRAPIAGVDISNLDANKQDRFYRLVGTLQSPCGQAHSLRASVESDVSCKRAPFAVRLVIALLGDEASDDDISEMYRNRYNPKARLYGFKLDDNVPHSGLPDAPVKLVEFFDFGCGGCKHFAPILKEAASAFSNEAVVYYKQFPLPSHPDSKGAAQAALAAGEQGKYIEMHELLFARAPSHKESDLKQYAASLGLDMGKFAADYEAMAARVKADQDEGNVSDVNGTPALFINGRMYDGPMHPGYIKMWITEELAVNR